MWGPYQAPREWGFTTVALPPKWAREEDQGNPLWPIPPGEEALGAPAFSITQRDADGSVVKTRRVMTG